MNTPIFDFVNNYSNSDYSRLHMPGHKGETLLGCENLDITEIKNADSLYEANDIILQSENNATELFSSKHTFYSTEGSSQCIKAMLYLALTCNEVSQRPVVLAARNVHKSFINAVALLDVDVEWLYSDNSSSICSCIITAKELEQKLSKMKTKPFAVYITSPDYLGGVSDIKSLAQICHNYGVPLLVDNAHGAYLKFISSHPIDLGADMCCDSAHKTLPCLTGGAYLHVCRSKYLGNARQALSIFGSTSPSYLILQSLDLVNKYISIDYSSELNNCIKRVDNLKIKLNNNGITTLKSDPLKLTIDANEFGYSGFEIAEILRKNKVECEYADNCYVVLMFTPQNKLEDFMKVDTALCSIKILKPIKQEINTNIVPQQKMSIRQAVFSPSETVNAENACGKICASSTVSCPPAIPIAISGELITKEHINLFLKYNIDKIDIIKTSE